MAWFLEEVAKAVERALKGPNDLDDEKKNKEGGLGDDEGGAHEELKDVVKTVGMVAGAGVLAWGTAKLLLSASTSSAQPPQPQPEPYSSEKDKKKMKAPGKNEYIYRDEFEGDAKGYFLKAREEKKLQKQLTKFA